MILLNAPFSALCSRNTLEVTSDACWEEAGVISRQQHVQHMRLARPGASLSMASVVTACPNVLDPGCLGICSPDFSFCSGVTFWMATEWKQVCRSAQSIRCDGSAQRPPTSCSVFESAAEPQGTYRGAEYLGIPRANGEAELIPLPIAGVKSKLQS